MATKPDTTRHPAADLSVAQLAAVAALLAGATDAEAATAAGVTRQTVNVWRNHHPGAIAAMNAGRAAMWERSADRLRGLVPMAIDVLEVTLGAAVPDPKTALDVLRLAGLADRAAPLTPTGPTTAAAVVDAEVFRRRRAADSLEELLTGGPITAHERRLTAAALTALGAGE